MCQHANRIAAGEKTDADRRSKFGEFSVSTSWRQKGYNVAEMRKLAKAQLPTPVFDFADGGAQDELTKDRNERAFADHALIPKPLNGAAARDLSIELFGQKLSMPIIIGPTGLSGLFWPHAERETMLAAAAAGTGMCVSHASTCTMEDLASTGAEARWMQVFIYKDRGFTRHFMERAQDTGFDALVLTVDNQLLGRRERDLKNGFVIPPNFGLAAYLRMIAKYRWLLRMAPLLGNMKFAIYERPGEDARLKALAGKLAGMLDPAMNWDDVKWVRDFWKKPLIIKGVLSPDEAERAIDVGADSIIVSNHGGRQLDGAIASLDALPAIVERVQGRIPILLDGGVRRGSDVLKTLALGATACLLGRPQLWGVSVAGQAGVEHILDVYAKELDVAMGLCGLTKISEISGDLICRTGPG